MNIKKNIIYKYKYIICTFLSLILLISATRDERDFSISKGLSIYVSLFRELDMFYVDSFEPQELVEKSITSLLAELDPYTVFYSEKNGDDIVLLTKGEYGGIGCMISERGNKIVISRVYRDSPSFRNNLKVGDEIISINSVQLKGKNIQEVSELLRGKANTTLEISVRRIGEKEDLNLSFTRETIQLNSVPYYGMLSGDVGYLVLEKFTDSASKDVRTALINLKAEGAKSIILDLRNNPGGLLSEAVDITNMFVHKGDTIVSTRGRIEKLNQHYLAVNNSIMHDMPLVVMINRSSASASEIVAGAIQDLDRGVVLGQRSFGKGLVQTTRDLVYKTQLKLTTAKYYTPSGRCVQALDYSHRREDGSVGNIPDSLISKFSTKNKRIVYDGGGISPDLSIIEKEYASVSRKLIEDYIIFDFVTEYLSKHTITTDASSFKLSDEVYNLFKNYIKKANFKYDTASEEMLKKLKILAKDEKYYNLAKREFESLEKKLSHSIDKDLEVFKSEIKELIAFDILQRIQYREGLIKYNMHHDAEIDSAVLLLNNTERYNNILRIK